MREYATQQIRNVGLFGHQGTGKTSLGEAMLFTAGAISRLGKVEDGNTVSDFDPDEIKRHISVNLSLLPLEWKGHKVNLIDTPGYADFVGEVREAMRVVDLAVMLVSAPAGVEVGTELAWQSAQEEGMPRLVVINKMDRENADFAQALLSVQTRLSPRCVAFQLPVGAQDRFQGVVDLIGRKAYLGAKGEETEIPAELQADAERLREQLVEAAAETDDDLIAKYLEGEELSEGEIRRAVATGIRSGQIVPVFAAAGSAPKGVGALLDALVAFGPSPLDRGPVKAIQPDSGAAIELSGESDGPLAALVFKTTADPHVGTISYFRVFSGTLQPGATVWNANQKREVRLGQLLTIRGKSQDQAQRIVAGDIGGAAKLEGTRTGDTLCTQDKPVLLPPIRFPTPIYAVAVEPKTKADMDKLGAALSRLVEEDPTLTVRKDTETNETILSGMGDTHIDVAIERMKRKFGVEVTTSLPKVPYRETITAPAKAEYKHKKQTGGHGQYGHVFLELEPLPRGSGFEFAERVVGGVVPKNYIPAVEKGIQETLADGPLAHYPVVDVKVTLYDGSYHSVDSSEMAFKLASSQAFKKGFQAARPVLLEPVMSVRIRVPEQYAGDVMSDLNTKRARIAGMHPEDGMSVIEALVPLAEMRRYAIDLRSITQGRGTYTMTFDHYEEVPAHEAQKVISEAQKNSG